MGIMPGQGNFGGGSLKRAAVLMSSYNGEKYITEQIESILAQEGELCLDLMVRDDGSGDTTLAILQSFSDQGGLKWYTGDNLGPARSFMELIGKAGGYDVYAFSDQDDRWLPDKLDRAIKAIGERQGPVLYLSNVRLADEALHDLGRNAYSKTPRTDFRTLSCAGGLLGCSMVFNDDLAKLLREKPVPEKLVMHDFYVALVCLACGGVILYDPRPSMQYRQHGGNVVGVACGLTGKIRSWAAGIVTKAPVSIADQAGEILAAYGDRMDERDYRWLHGVAGYRSRLTTRTALAASRKVKYINFHMGLKNRIGILFGNR